MQVHLQFPYAFMVWAGTYIYMYSKVDYKPLPTYGIVHEKAQ